MGSKLVLEISNPKEFGKEYNGWLYTPYRGLLLLKSCHNRSLSLCLSVCTCTYIHVPMCIYIGSYIPFPKPSGSSAKISWHFSTKYFSMHNPRARILFVFYTDTISLPHLWKSTLTQYHHLTSSPPINFNIISKCPLLIYLFLKLRSD